MRAACSFVLCLCFTLASSGATPTDRDEIDATIERAWSPWARPVDLDELADVDRRHIPYLLQRAAEERGAGGGELRSRMLYSAINRRAPEIFPFLLEHTSTTANPWTADGVARLSPPQVARLLELLAHTEEAVVRRVADALGQILYDDPALAARLARAHRGPLVDLLSAPSERVLHPVAALLARAAPPPAEAASTLVSRMRSSDEHERATAAQAFATLGIPDASAAIPLASILLHDDYSAAAEDAAVKVGQPAMRALLGRIEERSLVGRLAILRAFARHGVCDLLPPAYWQGLLAERDAFVFATALDTLTAAGAVDDGVTMGVRAYLGRHDGSRPESRVVDRRAALAVMRLCGQLRHGAADIKRELRAAMRAMSGTPPSIPALQIAPLAVALCLVSDDLETGMPIIIGALPRSGGRPNVGQYEAVALIGSPAIPYLLGALVAEDGGVHAGVAEALAYIRPSCAATAAALRSSLERDRYQGAQRALAHIGAAATPALILALADASPTLRARAAETFGIMAVTGTRLPAAARSALHARLRDGDARVRLAAVSAIAACGDSVAMALAPALSAQHPARRRDAAVMLRLGERAPTPHGVALLMRMLDDTEAGVRKEAAHAIGDLRPPVVSAIPRLRAILSDDSPEVRAYAARALWYLGVAAADMVDPLIMAMADGDALVREMASGALSTAPTRDGDRVGAWTRLLVETTAGEPGGASPYELGRIAGVTASALAGMGPHAAPAVPALMAYVRGGEGRSGRRATMAALGALGPVAEPAAPLLVSIAAAWPLAGRFPDDAHAAARALVDMGTPAATDGFVALVLQGHPSVGTLPVSGDRGARVLSLLVDALQYDDVMVRRNAARALAGIGRHAAVALTALENVAGESDGAASDAAARAVEQIQGQMEWHRRYGATAP
ncbi:hypothetical protein CMK11_20685 [Candidatus Poribacteria bacterium]|nr:hypothetical protein [Candidatus Poribacteria bacterium]